MDNGTQLEECKEAGRTQFYWYRKALDASPSIDESGGLVWHLVLVLLVAWAVVFLCMMRGVQSAGKVSKMCKFSPTNRIQSIMVANVFFYTYMHTI